MMLVKLAFALIALAVLRAEGKPSLPYGFHGVPDHLDFAPPVYSPAHFHAVDPAPLFPSPHLHVAAPAPAPLLPAPGHFLPTGHAGFYPTPTDFLAAAPQPFLAPAPLLPPAHFHAAAPAPLLPPPHLHIAAPAPAPLLPAAAPLLPAPAHLLPAPAPLLPAPAPLFPAPIVHNHILPAPAPILPPVYEAINFVEPIPSYRAIPGPKTTTHHVSVGYAFPQPHYAKVLAAPPHAHLHAAPLSLAHHHHHKLF